MVIAHHLIWTGYGWWLPNDPRGSSSQSIRKDILTELGALHLGRKRIQPAGQEIRSFYEKAKPLLQHPILLFEDVAINCIAAAFAESVVQRHYTVYACAIMPDHVHLLIRKHRDRAEDMIGVFQRESANAIRAAGYFPEDHRVWCSGGWKVFLGTPEEIWRTISYVEKNPTAQRLKAQVWPFVTKYDGWPLHAGHSPNSPYARKLRHG